jgi:hypothetical protein
MAIPLELLKATESAAPAIAIYGGPGVQKTLSVRTLPSPILLADLEGGSGSLTPWIRRKRNSDDSRWIEYTDEDRQKVYDLIREDFKQVQKGGEMVPDTDNLPAPLIDVIRYDPMRYETYNEYLTDLGNFQTARYNSFVTDSMHEFSQMTQTFSKGAGNEYAPMSLPLWGGAQERAAILLRRIKTLRQSGVFVYLTGAEAIDKDYEQDPRSLPKGVQPDQPYIIRGTIEVPGQLVGKIVHAVDILLHARTMSGKPTWVAVPEPVGSGQASWQVKERFGRLDTHNAPNFKRMCVKLYGKDGARAIYATNSNNS